MKNKQVEMKTRAAGKKARVEAQTKWDNFHGQPSTLLPVALLCSHVFPFAYDRLVDAIGSGGLVYVCLALKHYIYSQKRFWDAWLRKVMAQRFANMNGGICCARYYMLWPLERMNVVWHGTGCDSAVMTTIRSKFLFRLPRHINWEPALFSLGEDVRLLNVSRPNDRPYLLQKYQRVSFAVGQFVGFTVLFNSYVEIFTVQQFLRTLFLVSYVDSSIEIKDFKHDVGYHIPLCFLPGIHCDTLKRLSYTTSSPSSPYCIMDYPLNSCWTVRIRVVCNGLDLLIQLHMIGGRRRPNNNDDYADVISMTTNVAWRTTTFWNRTKVLEPYRYEMHFSSGRWTFAAIEKERTDIPSAIVLDLSRGTVELQN